MFTIEAHTPIVTVLLLENKTYQTNEFPLNVTVNEEVSQIRYSLDGKHNATATGNTTLSGLANGSHEVTIYAIDKVGKIGASETVTFAIDMPEQTTFEVELFQWFPVGAISLAIAAVVTIVYWKRSR